MVIIIHTKIEIALELFERFATLKRRNQRIVRVSFGRNWTEDVVAFFIPYVMHLSTLIFTPAHLHQRVK